MRQKVTITVVIHSSTFLILEGVAISWNMSVDEAIANILYRDAATMSGWPGQLGQTLREILRETLNTSSKPANNLFDEEDET